MNRIWIRTEEELLASVGGDVTRLTAAIENALAYQMALEAEGYTEEIHFAPEPEWNDGDWALDEDLDEEWEEEEEEPEEHPDYWDTEILV